LDERGTKMYDNALALTVLTSVFNVAWSALVLRSWRRRRGRVSAFATIGGLAFVVLGNFFLVYLAVAD
jgi:hypothetical protein